MTTHLSRLQEEHAPTLSQTEAIAAGRAERIRMPRQAHGDYEPGSRDPLAILDEQNETRVDELIPLRMGRMVASPFTFYRGTAAIMTADLARGDSSGITVVSCGDAHISNFGLFASPARTLVFDLNDFDEASPAPFEWDVKRFVTSVVIGARDIGLSDRQARRAARHAARSYRTALCGMMKLTVLQRYYFRLDTDSISRGLDASAQKVLDAATRQARKRTSQAFVDKIVTQAPDGTRLIVDRPPVLTHLPETTQSELEELFEEYRRTVPADIALLLSQFTLTDVARRVVGVGSVGTRCYILILTGPQQEALVLQVKEAQVSVLESYGGVPATDASYGRHADAPAARNREGHRVVTNQHILQAVSDPFLGFLSFDGRDYYVRQFRDMKGSIDVAGLSAAEYTTYVDGCGTILARAHAQSPNAAMIAGYLGKSREFDDAVVQWSFAYADQSLADYHLLQAAVDDGTVDAVIGI